jgi:uncharacterized membrane protein
VERLLIAIMLIVAFVIIVALLPKKLSLTQLDRPALTASVSPEGITVDAVELAQGNLRRSA